MESTDSERDKNACVMRWRAKLDRLQYDFWGDIESQMKEILMSNMDNAYRTAIKIVSLSGYNEDIAKEAVMRPYSCYGLKDMVSNIVQNTLKFLSGQGENCVQRENAEEDMKKFVENELDYITLLLMNYNPIFVNVGDVLWWFLVSDGNFIIPQLVNNSSFSYSGTNEIGENSTAPQLGIDNCSNENASSVDLDANIAGLEMKNAYVEHHGGHLASSNREIVEESSPSTSGREDNNEIYLLLYLVDILKQQKQYLYDWTHLKINQTVIRLQINKAERKSIKKGKDKFQKEKQTLEENAMKLVEMEEAILMASGQVEDANDTALRLQLENDLLRVELKFAKLDAAESTVTCQNVSEREGMTSKLLHKLDQEKTLFQEDLLTKKNQLSELQNQFEQMEKIQAREEAKWRREDKLKNEILAAANRERNELVQLEASTMSQEAEMMVKSENNLLELKHEIQRMREQQIELSRRRLVDDEPQWTFDSQWLTELPDSLDLGEEVKWECVFCLAEEASVVLLPCAHQVLCTSCNELHMNMGVQDCPYCRAPIKQRIFVCWSESS